MGNDLKATSILSEEHKNLSKVIEAISAECDRVESSNQLNKEFFEKTVFFIVNYADKSHHAKEEEILFPELKKDDVQMHCDPVPQMLYEHDEGRLFVKELSRGVEEGDISVVLKNARAYVDLIRDHIYKEDNILYPMADEALNDDAQKFMLAQFDEAEKLFAQGARDRCLAIVKEFEDKGG